MTILHSTGGTTSHNGQPEHALVDFVALAAQLTNEQKILIAQQAALACLERIERLIAKQSGTQTPVLATAFNSPPGATPAKRK
jgi:hypothetical protein